MKRVVVPQEDVEDLREGAQDLLVSARLQGLLQQLAPGAYGATIGQLQIIETLERSLAVLLAVRRAVAGRIAADRREGAAAGELLAGEERFCSLLSVKVALREALDVLGLESNELPPAERTLKLSEYRELLTSPEETLPRRLVEDLMAYLTFYGQHNDPRLRPSDDERLRRCVGSYLALLGRTAERLGDDGEYAAALEGVREAGLSVGGVEYYGFERRGGLVQETESELLPIWPEDIVGNNDVLEAGLKLCRSVAGYDFERQQNPQIVRNPVIFVLGAPGCGKTVTAHAIGNHFLDLCRTNNIPGRFRIIRRTDWASHFQNKSANELLRIFREEIFNYSGVAGVYWPDIDTAFAAREDPGVRGEEKALLGTLFGLLDGTVGPRNGKWFLIADANYLAMDEAMLSRLSQDPHYARGPRTAEDFVELLRDKKLKQVHDNLQLDEAAWLSIGELFCAQKLSGRAADNIAGKVLTMVEDVELPDGYFGLGFDAKRAMIAEQRRNISAEELRELVMRYVEFERDAEERARRERFDRRVTEIRERLAAQVAAVGVSDAE